MESHIHRSFNLFVLSWAGALVLLPCLCLKKDPFLFREEQFSSNFKNFPFSCFWKGGFMLAVILGFNVCSGEDVWVRK